MVHSPQLSQIQPNDWVILHTDSGGRTRDQSTTREATARKTSELVLNQKRPQLGFRCMMYPGRPFLAPIHIYLSIYLFNRCEVLNYCAKNAFPMPVFLCGFVCLLHLLKRRIASPAHVLVRFRLFRPPLSCRAIHPTKNFHAG